MVKPLWEPFPDSPQSKAYNHPADEIFYGGQAGGGKTDLVLGLAIMEHTKSFIFRREYPEMRAMIERSNEIIGGLGRFNENLHVWRDLPNGGTIEFAALPHEKSKEKYRGRPGDLYCFDEVTEMTESQYRFVILWNRSVNPDQRCRVLATGNPPTRAKGLWVIEHWAAWLDPRHENPAKDGELRWYTTGENGDAVLYGLKTVGQTPE